MLLKLEYYKGRIFRGFNGLRVQEICFIRLHCHGVEMLMA